MNLKDDALRGDRVTMFAQLAGISRTEALGRLALFWDYCVKNEIVGGLADRYIQAFLGVPADILVDAQLAERVGDGTRIRGVREEVESRRRRTEHARRAGFASAEVRATSQLTQLGVNSESTPSELRVNSESTPKLFSDLDLRSGSQISEASASSEIPEDLKQQGKGQKRRPRKPETECPSDFAPDDWHRQFCREHGIDLAFERDQFVDNHQGKGTLWREWGLAFRTWLRNRLKWNQARRIGAGKQSGIRSIPNL